MNDAKNIFSFVVSLEGESNVNQRKGCKKYSTYPSLLAEHEPRKHQRTDCNVRRLECDEGTVEEGDFHQKARDVLDPLLLQSKAHRCQPQPCFCRWMTQDPANSGKDVTLHLNEGTLFVRVAASLGKLLHCRYTVLGVFKFSSDPESGTKKRRVFRT